MYCNGRIGAPQFSSSEARCSWNCFHQRVPNKLDGHCRPHGSAGCWSAAMSPLLVKAYETTSDYDKKFERNSQSRFNKPCSCQRDFLKTKLTGSVDRTVDCG